MSLVMKSSERRVGVFEVSLIGKLDTGTYQQLEQQLGLLLKNRASAVLLDMTLLDYISSMGLRAVFKGIKDMKASGGLLMLTNLQPQIKKVFEIANAIDDDSIFTSVEEADRYYDSIQKRVKNG
ncbi:MAG: STAS domain-containing protein [Elusimicrobiales bacterium]